MDIPNPEGCPRFEAAADRDVDPPVWRAFVLVRMDQRTIRFLTRAAA